MIHYGGELAQLSINNQKRCARRAKCVEQLGWERCPSRTQPGQKIQGSSAETAEACLVQSRAQHINDSYDCIVHPEEGKHCFTMFYFFWWPDVLPGIRLGRRVQLRRRRPLWDFALPVVGALMRPAPAWGAFARPFQFDKKHWYNLRVSWDVLFSPHTIPKAWDEIS